MVEMLFKYVYRKGSGFRGACNHGGRRVMTGTYASQEEAALAVSRLIYKVTGSDEKLQVSLDAEQRRWLSEHSLEELQQEFKRASLKPGGKSGATSQYRGVGARKNKWRAKLQYTINGKSNCVLQKVFESETDAARAYDSAAVQWFGSTALTNFTYTEEQLISMGTGSKMSSRPAPLSTANPGAGRQARLRGRALRAAKTSKSESAGRSHDADSSDQQSEDNTSEPAPTAGARRELRARRAGPSLNVDAMFGDVSDVSDVSASDSAPESDDGGDSDYLAELCGAAGDAAECRQTTLHDQATATEVGVSDATITDEGAKYMMPVASDTVKEEGSDDCRLLERLQASVRAWEEPLHLGAASWGIPPALGPAGGEKGEGAACTGFVQNDNTATNQVPSQGLGPGAAERLLTELLVKSGVMTADAATEWITRSLADLAVGGPIAAAAVTSSSAAASALPSRIGAPNSKATFTSGPYTFTSGKSLGSGILPSTSSTSANLGASQPHARPFLSDAPSAVNSAGPLPSAVLHAATAAATAINAPEAAVSHAKKKWTRVGSKWVARALPPDDLAEEQPQPVGQPPPPPQPLQVHPAAAVRAFLASFEGRTKPQFIQLAEKVLEPILVAAEAIPMQPQFSPRKTALIADFTQRVKDRLDTYDPDGPYQFLPEKVASMKVENAPYDTSDWLGPWRGYISEKAKGPAGRAILAAMGVPPEEVPPAPARVLDPDLFFLRHALEWNHSKMHAIFGDLLPNTWDSAEYAATEEIPPRSVEEAQFYHDFPEQMPVGWTPEKEDAQEAADEVAIAAKVRAEIRSQRAHMDVLKGRRARGEHVSWHPDYRIFSKASQDMLKRQA